MRHIGMLLMMWLMLNHSGQDATNVSPTPKGVDGSELCIPRIERYQYSPQNPRDPFVPLLAQVDTEFVEGFLSSLELKGILVSEDKTLAVINDEILGIGDKIGAFTVKSIDPQTGEVILQLEDHLFKLKLEEVGG